VLEKGIVALETGGAFGVPTQRERVARDEKNGCVEEERICARNVGCVEDKRPL